MEELLRELILINREMLNELRMIRRSLGREEAGKAQEPSFAPQEPAFTPQEPAFTPQEPAKPAPPRFTPEDLEDMHGTLLEGLKKRNKDKSNAFSEFEKRHKNW